MQEFYSLIKLAKEEERRNLAELAGSAFGSSPETLCNHIRYLRAGSIGQLFWSSSWKQIVTDVADHVGIDWTSTLNGRRWHILETQEIEAAIVAKLFQNMLNEFLPDQRQQIVMEMEMETDDSDLEGLLLAGSVMAIAKMSDFGVYLLASTVLGSFTNASGVVLPFAVYTGMSQTIALVLGPIGWIALAGSIAFTLNQTNWERLVLVIVYVSILRTTLQS